MRCIEILGVAFEEVQKIPININMRCIEMLLVQDIVRRQQGLTLT